MAKRQALEPRGTSGTNAAPGTPLRVAAVAARRLEGPRCLRCAGPVEGRGLQLVCAACGACFSFTSGGVVETGAETTAFVHGIDQETDALVRLLEGTEAPACSERLIAAFAESVKLDVGNPVWEGRGDVARLTPGADGVVVDIGAGLGTIATAVARSAAHVYALDKSLDRARVTAARARVEGLTNVTTAHADGSKLPLGSETCDLALLIGALEWTGLDEGDPIGSQKAVLAEASRVIKHGGTLLIGIENRFGAHYFLGAREEHAKLRFFSLLPRTAASAYSLLFKGRKATVYTHSRRALLELVRGAGLQPRIGYALPSYSEPRLSFDAEDVGRAWDFYFRHIFRYSSTFRRIAGAAARLAPVRFLTAITPAFWLAAGKGELPARIPTVVTGSGDCAAEIKILDWEEGHVLRLGRRTGRLQGRVPLLEGWSASSWVSSPLLRRHRRERQRALIGKATALIASRDRRRATAEVLEGSLRAALAGIEHIQDDLTPATDEWCRGQISSLSSREIDMVEEHSDFAAVNLIVEKSTLRLRPIDAEDSGFAPAGLDAVLLTTDVLSLGRGRNHRDLEVALSKLLTAPSDVVEDIGRMLWSDFGAGVSVPIAVELTLGAVLRYATNNGPLPGIGPFLNRSAQGELELALRRLQPREGG